VSSSFLSSSIFFFFLSFSSWPPCVLPSLFFLNFFLSSFSFSYFSSLPVHLSSFSFSYFSSFSSFQPAAFFFSFLPCCLQLSFLNRERTRGGGGGGIMNSSGGGLQQQGSGSTPAVQLRT
jgi:hypothetical protein